MPRSSEAIWTFQRECSFFSFNILPINPIILQTFCLNVVLLKKKSKLCVTVSNLINCPIKIITRSVIIQSLTRWWRGCLAVQTLKHNDTEMCLFVWTRVSTQAI